MLALARRAGSRVYSRYLAVSVAALAVDLGLFLSLRFAGVPVMLVSALSYGAGIAAHWVLSIRLVFASDLRAQGAARLGQQTLFIASACVGLATTLVVVSLAGRFLDLRLAKLLAVGISFQLTWLLRSRIVFA